MTASSTRLLSFPVDILVALLRVTNSAVSMTFPILCFVSTEIKIIGA